MINKKRPYRKPFKPSLGALFEMVDDKKVQQYLNSIDANEKKDLYNVACGLFEDLEKKFDEENPITLDVIERGIKLFNDAIDDKLKFIADCYEAKITDKRVKAAINAALYYNKNLNRLLEKSKRVGK